jgi:hypothetical protein
MMIQGTKIAIKMSATRHSERELAALKTVNWIPHLHVLSSTLLH